MNLDPRIGKLANGQFYAFHRGYSNPEVIGSLADVERALGIPLTKEPKKSLQPKTQLQAFLVTVTPSVTTFAGSSTFGEYTVEIRAATASQAISEARRARRETEGRYGVPAQFKAKLLR